MATKREQLENAGILPTESSLSDEHIEAIESLSDEEIQAVIGARDKIREEHNLEALISPITHHH